MLYLSYFKTNEQYEEHRKNESKEKDFQRLREKNKNIYIM